MILHSLIQYHLVGRMAEGIGVWSSKLDNPMGMEVEEKHMKRFRNMGFGREAYEEI